MLRCNAWASCVSSTTAATYIDRDCDIAACASALYVHVNTVKYRLRRIEELCDVNLKNPNDLLKVTIAQLVLRLQEPVEG